MQRCEKAIQFRQKTRVAESLRPQLGFYNVEEKELQAGLTSICPADVDPAGAEAGVDVSYNTDMTLMPVIT